ncbi:MAG TPA: hypothetical protein VK776_22560 [Bryobacteraceae bacterium]|nr:hypothetical protein [Bryobacteraceae bacterium]
MQFGLATMVWQTGSGLCVHWNSNGLGHWNTTWLGGHGVGKWLMVHCGVGGGHQNGYGLWHSQGSGL